MASHATVIQSFIKIDRGEGGNTTESTEEKKKTRNKKNLCNCDQERVGEVNPEEEKYGKLPDQSLSD